jgi:hypothetical protein
VNDVRDPQYSLWFLVHVCRSSNWLGWFHDGRS